MKETDHQLAVLVSGSGTIMDAMFTRGVPIRLVAADRPCRGIELARKHGAETLIIDRRDYGWISGVAPEKQPSFGRSEFSADFADTLYDKGIDLVAMAGFMTVFAQPFFDVMGGQVLNTHPALLPSFPGAHGVRDALAYGVKVTGFTLHLATEVVDHGPILEQAAIRVEDDDTEESLQERIKVLEREIYPRVLKELLSGQRELPPLPH